MFMHSKYHLYLKFTDPTYLKLKIESSMKRNAIDIEKKQKKLGILHIKFFPNFNVISLKILH